MHIRNLMLAGLFVAVVAQPAFAGEGFYVGAGVGYEMPGGSGWQSPSFSQNGDYSLKNAANFIADAGYKFSHGFRIELEGQQTRFSGDKISINQFALTSPLDGHVSEGTLYLNANYDFPILPGLGGTVGAGLGSAWTSGHGTAFGNLAVVHGDDRSVAWQVEAGLVHQILPDLDLQVDYRYQGVGSATLTETGVGAFHLGDVKSHTVTANLRFYFLP